MFVEVSDFTGFYMLAKNQYSVDEIQDQINLVWREELNNLLGAELAQALIDDSGSGTPIDADLLTIFNPLYFDYANEAHNSGGIKEYLLGIMYFNFTITNRLKPSINGGVAKRKVEAAEIVDQRSEVYARYNRSVNTGKAIQLYIHINRDKYPLFKGKELLYNW